MIDDQAIHRYRDDGAVVLRGLLGAPTSYSQVRPRHEPSAEKLRVSRRRYCPMCRYLRSRRNAARQC